MKKESLAAGILLLIFLFSALNILCLRRLTLRLELQLDAAEASCTAEDYAGAERALNHALELWQDAEHYTHVFLRHSEVDAATEALYEALADVKDHPAEVSTSIRHLRHQLHELRAMNTPRLGSIF